jgi:hypothetical protein
MDEGAIRANANYLLALRLHIQSTGPYLAMQRN